MLDFQREGLGTLCVKQKEVEYRLMCKIGDIMQLLENTTMNTPKPKLQNLNLFLLIYYFILFYYCLFLLFLLIYFFKIYFVNFFTTLGTGLGRIQSLTLGAHNPELDFEGH